MRPNTIARRGAAAVAAGALVAAGSAIPAAAEGETSEEGGLVVTKTADRETVSKAGDVVTYTISVERPEDSEVSTFYIQDYMDDVVDNIDAFDVDSLEIAGANDVFYQEYVGDNLYIGGEFGESDVVTMSYEVVYSGEGNGSLFNDVDAATVSLSGELLEFLDEVLGEGQGDELIIPDEDSKEPEDQMGATEDQTGEANNESTNQDTTTPAPGETDPVPTEGSTDGTPEDSTNEETGEPEAPAPGIDETAPPAGSTEEGADVEGTTLFPSNVDAIVGNGADGSGGTATNASFVAAEFDGEGAVGGPTDEDVEFAQDFIGALFEGDLEWLDQIEGVTIADGYDSAEVLVKKAPVTSTPGGDDELAATGLSNGLKTAGIFGAALAGLGVVLTGVARAARRNSVQG